MLPYQKPTLTKNPIAALNDPFIHDWLAYKSQWVVRPIDELGLTQNPALRVKTRSNGQWKPQRQYLSRAHYRA